MASPDDDAAILEWSLLLMTDAFRELAFCLAIETDASKADDAIGEIEREIVARMEAFRDKPPAGVAIDAHVLATVMARFREMTQGTRAMIQKAGEPEH